MAPHSSTLAWKIPWTEEPGRLQSMGSLRVGHDWMTSLSLFTFMHWRRKWQPTPVFLPGKSHGQRSLVGYSSPWGCKESDTTERLHFTKYYPLMSQEVKSNYIFLFFIIFCFPRVTFFFFHLPTFVCICHEFFTNPPTHLKTLLKKKFGKTNTVFEV